MVFRAPEYANLINPIIPSQTIFSSPSLSTWHRRTPISMKKVKAGGYPLPEDWDPRGQLPGEHAYIDDLDDAPAASAAYVVILAPEGPRITVSKEDWVSP